MRKHRKRSAALATCLSLVAPCVWADVIANPNQIRGNVRLTNTSPAALAILNRPTDTPPGLGWGFVSEYISARSRPPRTPTLYASTQLFNVQALGSPYELTVESGPPGAGISYDVAVRGVPRQGWSEYNFAPRASPPVEYEPAPDVTVDVEECAAIVTARFSSTLGALAVDGGTMEAFRETAPGSGVFDTTYQARIRDLEVGNSVAYLPVRGDGALYHLVTYVKVGTDPYWNQLTFMAETYVRANCDEITDWDVHIPFLPPPPGGPGGGGGGSGGGNPGDYLGKVTGRLDVIGETEHRHDKYSFVQADDGPFHNFRYHTVGTTPSSGSFFLYNLMPSTAESPSHAYRIQGETMFRTGRRFERFTTPWLYNHGNPPVTVPESTTVDLGDVFVIDPGTLSGDILVAGPPPDPVLGSTLEDVARPSDNDANADGIPDSLASASSEVVSYGSLGAAAGAAHSTVAGRASVLYEGACPPGQSDFRGDYEMVVGGLYREPSRWQQPGLGMLLQDERTPAIPESYQYCRISMYARIAPEFDIRPGDDVHRSLHYCVSVVNLRVRSTGSLFFAPRVTGLGYLAGPDFEGTSVDQRLYLDSGQGTPRDLASAASNGLVVLTLPQGSWTLNPSLYHVNPGGGQSLDSLDPVSLEVGCRQVITASTDLLVEVASLPRCGIARDLTVSGRVRSPTAIDRISHRLNGGPSVTDCTSCGIAPPFSFQVTLADGLNQIDVTTVSALGDQATTRVVTTLDTAPAPADMGNVLLATRSANDAAFTWTLVAGAASTELLSSVLKPFTSPVSIGTSDAPSVTLRDPGAVNPGRGPLLFYRVRGLTCGGIAGPY